MHWRDAALLDELGFSIYEKKTLVTLAHLGVADAGTLCREGAIPTSKIYRATEKLAQLGLIAIQPTRPKLYAALTAEVVTARVLGISRERADAFAAQAESFGELLAAVRCGVRGKETFVDLALGVEGHIKRHLVQLAGAEERICSYLEQGDLLAIDQAVKSGFPILRRIARNAAEHQVRHRVVFGFDHRNAPRLVEFLRNHRADLAHLTGVRYSGEFGHPFHLVDKELVVLPLDHPFIPEGRFASLLVRDAELARSLSDGFEALWEKAMRDLREIRFHPGSRGTPGERGS